MGDTQMSHSLLISIVCSENDLARYPPYVYKRKCYNLNTKYIQVLIFLLFWRFEEKKAALSLTG